MPEILRLLKDQFKTPIGEMLLAADHEDRMLRLLRRHYGKNGFALVPNQNPSGLTQTIKSYFAGEFSSLDAVPTRTAGTPILREMWRSLRYIPCGVTISYGSLPNGSAGQTQ